MTKTNEPGTLTLILYKQQILDCIHRYARGVDRLDEALVLSAFHEDSIDAHGPFTGPPREFVAWLWPRQTARWCSHHYITNHSVEVDGSTAHAETYYLAVMGEGETLTQAGGRYIDRFELRHGEWKIAARRVLVEWTVELDAAAWVGANKQFPIGTRDRTDLSYQRPLSVGQPTR